MNVVKKWLMMTSGISTVPTVWGSKTIGETLGLLLALTHNKVAKVDGSPLGLLLALTYNKATGEPLGLLSAITYTET